MEPTFIPLDKNELSRIPKKGEFVAIPLSEKYVTYRVGDGIHPLSELVDLNTFSTVVWGNIIISQMGNTRYITEDGGKTWTEQHIEYRQLSDIKTKVIGNELNLSSDNGETWQPLEEFIANYANKYSNSDNRIIKKLLGE